MILNHYTQCNNFYHKHLVSLGWLSHFYTLIQSVIILIVVMLNVVALCNKLDCYLGNVFSDHIIVVGEASSPSFREGHYKCSTWGDCTIKYYGIIIHKKWTVSLWLLACTTTLAWTNTLAYYRVGNESVIFFIVQVWPPVGSCLTCKH